MPKDFNSLRNNHPNFPWPSEFEPLAPGTSDCNSEPTTTDTVCEFLVSQGIPFESVRDSSLKKLIKHLNPNCEVPTEEELKCSINKIPIPKIVNSRRAGPISVTLDVVRAKVSAEEPVKKHYIAFSVHHFENLIQRRDTIFFKKVNEAEISVTMIIAHIQNASRNFKYRDFTITNMVSPDRYIFDFLAERTSQKLNHYTCTYNRISEFANSVINSPAVRTGLNSLRIFIVSLKTGPTYKLFAKTLDAEKINNLKLPTEDGSWVSTYAFLSRCVELHTTLIDYCSTMSGGRKRTQHISNSDFDNLQLADQILRACVQIVHELSAPNNSISQVIPAIRKIRHVILSDTTKCSGEGRLRKNFTDTFKKVTQGSASTRYHLATFLDPRFAYQEDIYPMETWLEIEKELEEQFLIRLQTPCDFVQIVEDLPKEYYKRVQILQREIEVYKKLIQNQRARDPFEFWRIHQDDSIIYLSQLAKEFLACPAVSLDAFQFFGEDGKYNRMCSRYTNDQHLSAYLDVASSFQEYRPHGFHIVEQKQSELAEAELRDRSRAISSKNVLRDCLPGTSSSNLPVAENLLGTFSATFDCVQEVKQEATEEEPSDAGVKHLMESLVSGIPLGIQEPSECVLEEEKPRDIFIGTDTEVKKEPIDPEYHEEAEQMDELEVKKELDEYEEQAVPSTSESVTPTAPTRDNIMANITIPRTRRVRCCIQCGNRRPDVIRKIVSTDYERLLLLLSAFRNRLITLDNAKTRNTIPTASYCISHLTDACDEIFSIFRVRQPEDILDVKEIDTRVLGTAITIAGDKRLHFCQFQEYCRKFTIKNCQKSCSICQKIDYRKDMANIQKHAGRLANCMKSGTLEAPATWKYMELNGSNLIVALEADTEGYICFDHFPTLK